MQQNLPELPAARRARYVSLGLPAADAVVLADEPPTAAYFDAVLAAGAPAKPAANWVMGDIMAFCKACTPGIFGFRFPQTLPQLMQSPNAIGFSTL